MASPWINVSIENFRATLTRNGRKDIWKIDHGLVSLVMSW
jgi:hypothetical protein